MRQENSNFLMKNKPRSAISIPRNSDVDCHRSKKVIIITPYSFKLSTKCITVSEKSDYVD